MSGQAAGAARADEGRSVTGTMSPTSAEQKRVNLVSGYFRRAYDDDAKVVYTNSLVPSEILLSFGAVPFHLGSVSGIFAQARAAANLINVGEQQFLSSDLCSTSKCVIGAVHKNAMPTPEFLVLTSGPCDVDSHLIHAISQAYQKEAFLLDVPLYYQDEAQALDYLEGQIGELVRALERHLGVPFSMDRLRQAFVHTNETLRYVEKINALAACVPAPLPVIETIEIIASLHLLGTPELAEVYREKYLELSARVQPGPAPARRQPRILWHWLRPYYTNQLFEHLVQQCKVELLSEYDVMGIGFYGWEPVGEERPFRALARRLLRGSINYAIASEEFVRELPDRARRFSIDGVIAFSPRGCRHLVSMNQVLRDIFTERGLPFLEVDCDCIDERDYSFSRIKTRLDAFAEMLHERMA